VDASRDARVLELEDRLLDEPGDVLTSQVWADRLCELGDPRGELVALDRAIAQALAGAEPTLAQELSQRRALFFREHFLEVFDRPGGFPFRERYQGRSLLLATVARRQLPECFFRVQRFVRQLTDMESPVGLRLLSVDMQLARSRQGDAPDLDRQFCEALRPAEISRGSQAWHLWRTTPEVALHDEGRLRDLLELTPEAAVLYRFRMVWPGTKDRLPYQESGHYPGDGDEPLTSTMTYSVAEGLNGSFFLPFEDPDDPVFGLVRDSISLRLGPLLGKDFLNHLTVLEPSSDGRQLIPRGG
jgi:hypothetical protein